MAELRSSFAILEDVSTQAGLPLHKALEGDSITGVNAQGALVAKDASDQFAYLKVNSSNELLVNFEGDDVACLDGYDVDLVGSATYADIVTVSLSASTVYKNVSFAVSCYRDTKFKIYWVADAGGTPVEEVLAVVRVTAGQPSVVAKLSCSTFTTSGTGDQELRIAGINENALSEMDASVHVEEVQ